MKRTASSFCEAYSKSKRVIDTSSSVSSAPVSTPDVIVKTVIVPEKQVVGFTVRP